MPKRNRRCFERPFISASNRNCLPTSTEVVLVFKTLWGWNGSLGAAAKRALVQGFDGLECNVAHPCLQGVGAADVQKLLEQRGQALILEIRHLGYTICALLLASSLCLASRSESMPQLRYA